MASVFFKKVIKEVLPWCGRMQKEENKTRLTQTRAMAGDDPQDPSLPMKLMIMCMPLIIEMATPTLTK